MTEDLKPLIYYANVYKAVNDPIVFVSRVFKSYYTALENIKENLNEDCSFVQTKYVKTINFTVP